MCKIITLIASILLGGAFIIFGLNFFFQFMAIDGPAEGSNAATFIGVLYTTGYLGFVKILELGYCYFGCPCSHAFDQTRQVLQTVFVLQLLQ